MTASEKKQLIVLIPDSRNLRIKHAKLTESGRQLYDAYILKMRRLEEAAWISMDAKDRSSLSELTWKLYHLIEELYHRSENEK